MNAARRCSGHDCDDRRVPPATLYTATSAILVQDRRSRTPPTDSTPPAPAIRRSAALDVPDRRSPPVPPRITPITRTHPLVRTTAVEPWIRRRQRAHFTFAAVPGFSANVL
jgi:hypothetical protein